MKALSMTVLVLLILSLSFAASGPAPGAGMTAPGFDKRNYYCDEVSITKQGMPTQFKRWGEQGAPERGYFEQIEAANPYGPLKTTYGALLEEDALGYICDPSGRISELAVNGELRSILPAKAQNYTKASADRYARGMAETITSTMDGRVFVTLNGNCMGLLAPEVYPLAKNTIRQYHYMFPYIHVVESKAGWCMNEP